MTRKQLAYRLVLLGALAAIAIGTTFYWYPWENLTGPQPPADPVNASEVLPHSSAGSESVEPPAIGPTAEQPDPKNDGPLGPNAPKPGPKGEEGPKGPLGLEEDPKTLPTKPGP